MRLLYDVFCFVFVMLGAFCVGTGIAMFGDASVDALFEQGRHAHPDVLAIVGVGFAMVGGLIAWFTRFSYNFWTMTRIR